MRIIIFFGKLWCNTFCHPVPSYKILRRLSFKNEYNLSRKKINYVVSKASSAVCDIVDISLYYYQRIILYYYCMNELRWGSKTSAASTDWLRLYNNTYYILYRYARRRQWHNIGKAHKDRFSAGVQIRCLTRCFATTKPIDRRRRSRLE